LQNSALIDALGQISEWPLTVVDQSQLRPSDVLLASQRVALEHKDLAAVFVDGLWLMTAESDYGNRVQELTAISRGVKVAQRHLNVPIMITHQLSRAPSKRSDPRPILSDLRDCVTGDTLVVLANGQRVPIDFLVDTTPPEVASMCNGKLTIARSRSVWCVGKRPVFRVDLASGRTIKATAEHRLWGANGWQRVNELQVEHRVAIARTLPEPACTAVWRSSEIMLLAHLIGDGSYLTHQPLRYTTASDECSDIVRRCAELQGSSVRRTEGRGNWHQLIITGNGNRWHHKGVNAWLRSLGIWNQRSCEKEVPAEVFQLCNDDIALFLRHLWATDGTISPQKDGGKVSVDFLTCSEKLARDVAALLLRLSIVARLRKRKKDGTIVVSVSGAEDQLHFLNEVGAFGHCRDGARYARSVLSNKVINTNVDTLPVEVRAYIRSIMRDRGITSRGMRGLRGRTSTGSGDLYSTRAPSRSTIADYGRALGDACLIAMAESDLFWDRVIGIKPLGEEDVFDLTVPSTQSWLADGIVSHNSGGVEQDADVVLMLYREKYYDQAADDVIELWVRKNRFGGSNERVKMYWVQELGRLERLSYERTG